MGRVRIGVAADEGVVHEGVRVGGVAEEAASVVEGAGDVDGAVEEQLSGDELVDVECRFGGVSLQLLEGSQGSASAQE